MHRQPVSEHLLILVTVLSETVFSALRVFIIWNGSHARYIFLTISLGLGMVSVATSAVRQQFGTTHYMLMVEKFHFSRSTSSYLAMPNPSCASESLITPEINERCEYDYQLS